MRGRLYTWIDSTGWQWYPVAAIEDVSKTLDVLAQTVGSILVRATDRWRAPVAGTINDVLTYKGATTPPVWQTPSAGGIQTGALAGSPVSPDNTVALYDFDVSSFAEVEFAFQDLGIAASTSIHFRLSTDGGTTYKAAAADYRRMYTNTTGEVSQNGSTINASDGNASANINGFTQFNNLRAGRAMMLGLVGSGDSIMTVGGFARFDGPITNIRFLSGGGANFNAGRIDVTGMAAA